MTGGALRRSLRRRLARRADLLSHVGHLLITLGVVTVLFGGYQLWFTDTVQRATQTRLIREVRDVLPDGTTPRVTGPAAPLTTQPDPGEGHWVGTISIPAIHLEQVIVNGTSVNDLRLGPGHYLGTPLPGEAGNVAIAGHRTTWGAPFRNLDKLTAGDQIVITTPRADVLYRVTSSTVVAPTDMSVIAPTGSNTLTLTTCHPAYSASQRLVVRATLAAVGHLRPAQHVVTVSKVITRDTRPHSWRPLLLWGALAMALYLVARRLLRTSTRRILVLGAAVVLAVPVLLGLFSAISWLLPAGY